MQIKATMTYHLIRVNDGHYKSKQTTKQKKVTSDEYMEKL